MEKMIDMKSSMKESSFASFGTPNDVRLFPGTSSAPTSMSSSTRSIPIANSERSLKEIQQDEEEALAEYRDQAMYLRIVHGMKEKRSASTSQITLLHDCVTDSVAKIARTRNSQLVQDNRSGHYLFKESSSPFQVTTAPPTTVNNTKLGYQNVLQRAATEHGGIFFEEHATEDEGIFEMDL